MKKLRSIKAKVHNYHVNDFIQGFHGESGEGIDLLSRLGYADGALPFSVAAFLKSRRAMWRTDGQTLTISFRLKPGQIECTAQTYLNQSGKRTLKDKKSMRLFCEWGAWEDREMVSHLESEAIGDLCMKCLAKLV